MRGRPVMQYQDLVKQYRGTGMAVPGSISEGEQDSYPQVGGGSGNSIFCLSNRSEELSWRPGEDGQ